MNAKAIKRYSRQGARKVRLLADLIRGRDVEDAINILHFSKKKASTDLEKTVRGAIANLVNLEGGNVNPENLYVKEVYVDGGPSIKRFRPRAMGSATPILKRTAHMTVIVATPDERKIKVRG